MAASAIVVFDSDTATRDAAAAVAFADDCTVCQPQGLADLARAGVQPVLAIVDVDVDGPSSGLELMTELLRRFGPWFPVILVSANGEQPMDRVAGLLLGADDFVTKPFVASEFRARIQRSLRRVGALAYSDAAARAQLSAREHEVLKALAAGRTQIEIAHALFISPKTVGTHIQHLLVKLGVHNRAQAVSAAFQLGLVGDSTRGLTVQAQSALR